VRSASTNRGTKKARDGGEPVNFWLSRTLADRIDAAAAAIGFTRTELIRRAIEAECFATEWNARPRPKHERETSGTGMQVNIRLGQTLLARINAAAAANGFTQTELIRRAIETECVATEELSVWRDHEFGRPAIDA